MKNRKALLDDLRDQEDFEAIEEVFVEQQEKLLDKGKDISPKKA